MIVSMATHNPIERIIEINENPFYITIRFDDLVSSGGRICRIWRAAMIAYCLQQLQLQIMHMVLVPALLHIKGIYLARK